MKLIKSLSVICTVYFIFSNILFGQVDTAWVRRYDGPGNGNDWAYSLAVDGQENVYVTGYSYGSGTSRDYTTIKYDSAGDTLWVRRYNGPGNSDDWAWSLAVDGPGNVYVTGASTGSGTSWDYATIKYNSAGIEQWVQRYNGPGNSDDWAYSLAVDGQGNVYVAGYSVGSGIYLDYATIKYNSAGMEQWVARYNGPGNSSDVAQSLAVDGQGNVYVTGGSTGSGTYSDYATIKYDSAGVEQWVQRYNGPGNGYMDRGYSLAVDGQGNVYVTGGSAGSGTDYDYATIKYNSAGMEQWVARYNGPGNIDDVAYSLALDGQGNVCVTGYSCYSAGTSTYPFNYDYATIKYNSAGVEQWVQRYSGPGNSSDFAQSLALDGQGNVYVTGLSIGSGTSFDYATVKYNSAGIEQWIQRYNGPGNIDDKAYSLALDGQGNVYVTGSSTGSTTSYDYATIKYVQTGAIEENQQPLFADRLSLKIFPNPAKTYFTIRMPQSADISLVKIFDVSGKQVGDCFATARNDNVIRVSLDGIKNGIYIVKVGNDLIREKLIFIK